MPHGGQFMEWCYYSWTLLLLLLGKLWDQSCVVGSGRALWTSWRWIIFRFSINYLQVFMQKWRHCIQVEILDLSELAVFSYKFYTSFSFLSFGRIFHPFQGPLNILSACFGAKTTTLYSCQNNWPVGQKGIFKQILPDFFYLCIFQ